MPFAVIGVVLLIIGSAYGVMITQVDESEEAIENMVTELDSLDNAMVETKTSIERGLGEIIFDISTDPDAGKLKDRADLFKERSSKWITAKFPSMNKGVDITISDFDFDLTTESLKMTSSDIFMEGSTPTYLKATGHYTAKFISGSGTSVRTVEISSDGTCALPLVVEQGSLFENMTSGSGSALSQIMTYQLSSLAQYRVLNGYGALSEYGSMGTMSIITPDDVRSSYDSSLKLIEMLAFRSSDGYFNDMERVDMADILVSNDGYLDIDLSAVYSQALISISDDLVLRWFDYLYGNLLIDKMDGFMDDLLNAWDSLKGFFTKRNEFSAAPYIERVLRDNGSDVDRQRYLFSGRTGSLNVPDIKVLVNNETITLPASSISIQYPSVDLMSWDGISNFKSDHREETNEIREWIRNVINSAAVGIASNRSLGTISLHIDADDDESLMDAICKAVEGALSKGNEEIEKKMESAIREQNISDPFYASIFRVISNAYVDIYGIPSFINNVRTSVEDSILASFKENSITLKDQDLKKIIENIMESNDVRGFIREYELAVQDCVEQLAALERVPGGQPGIIKDISRALLTKDILLLGVGTNVPDRILTLCQESRDNMNINGYNGTIDLHTTDEIILTDRDGSI